MTLTGIYLNHDQDVADYLGEGHINRVNLIISLDVLPEPANQNDHISHRPDEVHSISMKICDFQKVLYVAWGVILQGTML